MNEKFIIFGRSTCPFCNMAADFLSCKKAEVKFFDFVKNPSILEDYKDFYKQKTVPIIISNHKESGLVKKIGGYTDLLEYFSNE